MHDMIHSQIANICIIITEHSHEHILRMCKECIDLDIPHGDFLDLNSLETSGPFESCGQIGWSICDPLICLYFKPSWKVDLDAEPCE